MKLLNDILQLLCIILFIIIVWRSLELLSYMRYCIRAMLLSICKWFVFGIIKRKWNPAYLMPIKWLSENYIFIAFMLFVVGFSSCTFTFMRQFIEHKVSDKSPMWFTFILPIAAGVLGIIFYYRERIRRAVSMHGHLR